MYKEAFEKWEDDRVENILSGVKMMMFCENSKQEISIWGVLKDAGRTFQMRTRVAIPL